MTVINDIDKLFNIEKLVSQKRLGLTIFRIERPKPKAFESLVKILEKENKKKDKIPIGYGNRYSIEFNKWYNDNNVLYISFWMEEIIKWLKIDSENDPSRLVEEVAYQKQDVIIKTDYSQNYASVFSKSNRIATKSCSRIRDLTIGNYNPTKITIDNSSMTDILQWINDITFIKIQNKEQSWPIDSISFSGTDILNTDFTTEILEKEESQLIEIKGLIKIEDEYLKININRNGRIWFYFNPENIETETIYNIIERIISFIKMDEIE